MRSPPARIALPTLFERIGYSPHEAQLKVHLSEARYRVCVWGVRAGKSTCGGVESVRAALEPGDYRVVWCVAPSYELCDKVFREVVRIVERHFAELILPGTRWSDRKILLRNFGGGQTEIRGKSGDNPESLLGEGVDFMVVDEASRLKAEVWEAYLSQRLIDKRGRALLISTPKGRNYYFQLYQRGQPGPDRDPAYESWHFPSWVNPLLPREDIEKERERLPAGYFAQEFEASFVDGEGSVFRCVRDRATLAWPSSTGIPPVNATEYAPSERYSAGLDLAQVHDFTVLAILDSKRNVVRLDRFNKLSWDVQIPRIVHALKLYGSAPCHVDATGVGSSIFERLRNAGANVRPYTMTNASKVDLMNNVAALLEHGQITLPQPKWAPELINELEAYAYSMGETGTVRMSAPGAGHDDCVVALALAAWGCRPESICRVQFAHVGLRTIDPETPNPGGMGIQVTTLGPEGARLRGGLLSEILRRG